MVAPIDPHEPCPPIVPFAPGDLAPIDPQPWPPPSLRSVVAHPFPLGHPFPPTPSTIYCGASSSECSIPASPVFGAANPSANSMADSRSPSSSSKSDPTWKFRSPKAQALHAARRRKRGTGSAAPSSSPFMSSDRQAPNRHHPYRHVVRDLPRRQQGAILAVTNDEEELGLADAKKEKAADRDSKNIADREEKVPEGEKEKVPGTGKEKMPHP